MTVKARSKLAKDFIDKGGDTKKESKGKREGWIFLNLHVPPEYIEGISESIKQNGHMSRNAWILQAINEKIEKECKKT